MRLVYQLVLATKISQHTYLIPVFLATDMGLTGPEA
jgi:hypothetical protein